MNIKRALLAAALLWAASVQRAEAGYHTFVSGPAVIAKNVQSSGIHGSTVVFGRVSGGTFSTIARQGNNTVWMYGPSELLSLTVPGGYDSDPAAAYINGGWDIMVCGHAAGGPGNMYCSIGSVNYQQGSPTSPILFPVKYGPVPAGAGTFYPGTNPAMVTVGASNVYLFAIGQDGYVWYAVANVSGFPSWNGWYQIPGTAANGGFSANLAAVATDANGGILVCAWNTIVGTQCNKLTPSVGWGGWAGTPFATPPISFQRYSATRSSNAVWLMGVGYPDTHAFGTYTVDQGAHWSSLIQQGAGSGFLSKMAVVATTAGSTVLSVGRGSDSVFWYNIAGAQGWYAIGSVN